MPKINMTKFRADVKRAKEGLGLTQRQLGAQTGLGHAALSRLFCGKMKRPTYKTFNTLCAALGLEREDYFGASSDVEKTHEAAKATLARANAMLDEVREKLDTAKVTAEDTSEAVANDLAEERLAALEEAHARIKELEAENKCLRATLPDCDPGEDKVDDRPIEEQLEDARFQAEAMSRHAVEAWNERDAAEQKFTNAENEIAELKQALDIKNNLLKEKSQLADSLTVNLRADDKLILELLSFLARMKAGDVAR